MKKLIIIGGYGNGSVVQSTVADINAIKMKWELIGFLNDGNLTEVNGFPVLGKIDKSTVDQYLADPDVYFFYTLISVKLNYRSLSKLTELQIPE